MVAPATKPQLSFTPTARYWPMPARNVEDDVLVPVILMLVVPLTVRVGVDDELALIVSAPPIAPVGSMSTLYVPVVGSSGFRVTPDVPKVVDTSVEPSGARMDTRAADSVTELKASVRYVPCV